MKFNHENKTIEMSRTEATKANIYGSEAYKNLMKHKTAMPNYEIAIIKRNTSKSKSKDKGLTYSFMERYILAHDNSEENMKEFEKNKKEAKLTNDLSTSSYVRVRDWFLETYSEVSDFIEKKSA